MEYNSSGLRSPFSPRSRQHIGSPKSLGISTMRKNKTSKFLHVVGSQSGEVIYRTQQHIVETYGLPLPVMVTEALTFASSEVSVRLSSCGWCWLVTGRRVLVWPQTDPPASPIARELTLPQTDLAHKADLVMLYYEEENQMPSCVGISPEGVVRYWPSVAQESVYVDQPLQLDGQECELLTEPGIEGLILATTTCTVVLLTPHMQEGRADVMSRLLRPPGGWLGGLGRRVSVLFFGSMPTQFTETRLVGVALIPIGTGTEEAETCVALVARGPVLQLWRHGPELLEHDLRRPLREALTHSYPAYQGETSGIEIVALEVRAAAAPASVPGLQLLIAAIDEAHPADTFYAIAHVYLGDMAAPRVTSLVPVQRGGPPSPLTNGDTLRFLSLGARTLLYTTLHLAIVSSTVANDKPEVVDMTTSGDRLLAAEVCGGVPLVFTRAHGLLRLATAAPPTPARDSSASGPGSPLLSDLYDGNLSFYEIDPHEVSLVSTDACGKLKTAFLYHVRRDALACRAILDELFPATEAAAPHSPQRRSATAPTASAPPSQFDVDGALDRTVVAVGREILDDVPAGDPRWKSAPAAGVPLGSSNALQIAAHLRDKQRAFGLFVEFLRATSLWQRLQYVTCDNGCGSVSTRALLGEFPERLAAATALRRLQRGSDASLIDAALQHVMNSGEDVDVEEAVREGVLSPADVVYRRVSRVARALHALSRLARAAPPSAAPQQLHQTALLLLTVMEDVRKCRAQWLYAVGEPSETDGAHAWTSHLAADSLLAEFIQLQLTLTRCAASCKDATQRGQLYEQAMSLARYVLEEAEHLARSPRTAARYEALRRDVIRPLLEDGQHERAALLAETFRDFELLVEICVRVDDFERLYGYIEKYADEGLAEVSFAWLAERGGSDAVQLVRRLGVRYPRRLAAWLAAAPDRAPLLALHHLSSRNCMPAARALHDIAVDETRNLHRMTTACSMAKLCLMAADSDDDKEKEVQERLRGEIERRLALADHHTALPRAVRLRHALADDDSALYAPRDLVEMYVATDSTALTEYDYKKALDLADLVDDPMERDDLRLRVWCATLRADEWSSCQTDSPQEVLHTTTFFRLVDLVHQFAETGPPPADEVLAAPAARAFARDDRFKFLLRYGYEALQQEGEDSPSQPQTLTVN